MRRTMLSHDIRLNGRIDKVIAYLERVNIGAAYIGENIAGLVEAILDGLFDSILAGLKKIIPWIVTLGPAAALYTSLVEPFAASTWLDVTTARGISLGLALGFEGLGLFITRTLANVNDWNQTKNKSDEMIPTTLLKWFLVLYIIGGMVLVLSVKGWADPIAWFFAAMFIIGPMAHTTSEIADKTKRLIRDKRTKRRSRTIRNGLNTEIKMAQVELAQLAATVDYQKVKNDPSFRPNDGSLSKANGARKVKKEKRQEQVIMLLTNHSQAEIARILNVSASTVRRDIKELNGHINGKEVNREVV